MSVTRYIMSVTRYKLLELSDDDKHRTIRFTTVITLDLEDICNGIGDLYDYAWDSICDLNRQSDFKEALKYTPEYDWEPNDMDILDVKFKNPTNKSTGYTITIEAEVTYTKYARRAKTSCSQCGHSV